MKRQEIKISIMDVLRGLYPDEKIYGIETVKGFKKPCLFLGINTEVIEGNLNVKHKTCHVEIIQMQDEPDEAEALEFFDKMEKAFYPKMQVGERYLTTEEFETDYIGEAENIPRMEFTAEYYEDAEKPKEKAELLKNFRIKEELR